MEHGPENCWKMSEEEFYQYANPAKLMVSVGHLHHRKMERLLDGTGLHRAQHRTLMVLSKHEPDSQVELAKLLDVSTATVAVALKKLERDGYITKTVKAEDSRAKFVTVTEKGRNVVEKSREIFDYVDGQLISGFSQEELVSLRGFMKRMHENLLEIKEERNGK